MGFQTSGRFVAPFVLALQFGSGVLSPAEGQNLAGIKPCEGKQASLISRQTINLPPPGVETEVELGQSMVSALQGDLMAERLVLASDATFSGSYVGAGYQVTIPAGELEPASFKGKSVYAATGAIFKYSRDGKPRRGLSKPDIFVTVDANDTSKLTGLVALGFVTQTQPIANANFKVDQCINIGLTGFRRELIYSGVSKGTVTIQYREFFNDMARPAFSQELRYDLSDGTEIGFKGSRFQIVKASNVGVVFKVIKPLD